MKFDPTTQSDKCKVIASLFKRGSETIVEFNEQIQDPSMSEGVNRILRICNLKVNESPADAADMITLHNFEIEHLPAHLISQAQVWEILIPKLTYPQLLKILPSLHSLNMLRPTETVSKKLSMSIGNANLIAASGVHPLEVFAVSKLYEKNARYNEYVKVCLSLYNNDL